MKQLDPKSVWLFFAGFLARTIWLAFIFSLVAFSWASGSEADVSLPALAAYVILAVVVIVIITFIWAKLTYRFYKYDLTDLGFRKESGVIYKKYVTIPYARIQNVDINRGILARLLGLSDLQIQTAGSSAVVSRYGISGAGAEGRLPGISVAIAEELRDELIRKANHTSQGSNSGL